MAKLIVVDFYVVRVSGNDSLQDAMRTLNTPPEDAGRNLEFQDAPVRLRVLTSEGQNWSGDIMKIRLNEPAIIASLDGSIEPVSGIDEDRGLGENTAFQYDHLLNVMAVQRNRTAINASKLAHYISSKGNLDNALILEPLLRLEAYEQLRSMSTIKKFRLKIARPADLSQVAPDLGSVADAAKLAADFRSPTIEVTFSMGRRSGSLAKASILKAVRGLFASRSVEEHLVEKIEVSGRFADDERTEALDLIEQRLQSRISVELSPLPDEFYRRRQGILTQALQEKRAELRSLVRMSGG